MTGVQQPAIVYGHLSGQISYSIPAGNAAHAKQSQQLRLQYLSSLIYQGHIKSLQTEQFGLGRQRSNRSHKIRQRAIRSSILPACRARLNTFSIKCGRYTPSQESSLPIRMKSTSGVMAVNILHISSTARLVYESKSISFLPIKSLYHAAQSARGLTGSRRTYQQEIVFSSLRLQSNTYKIIGSSRYSSVKGSIKFRFTLIQQQIPTVFRCRQKADNPQYMQRKEVSI